MNSINRIIAFAKLGEIFRHPNLERFPCFGAEIIKLNQLIESSQNTNGWFTPENVAFAIESLGQALRQPNIEKWIKKYPKNAFDKTRQTTVAAVMAGNIPLVGFHDYLCVMLCGHRFLGKLSSDDKQLLPLIHKIMEKIEPGFKGRADFTEGKIENFDAVIATGSNNTARYFEYYFNKYPHIIRKNRNGVAVIKGNESNDELSLLGEDIFSYYGLGCRNVSKIYVPENYSFEKFFQAIEKFKSVLIHHKYANNYDYNKSIYLINSVPHLDNGFLMLTEQEPIPSPISVVHYESYQSVEKLSKKLQTQSDEIQCLVSIDKAIPQAIPPGEAQKPQLWDYADNVDTIEFLQNIPD